MTKTGGLLVLVAALVIAISFDTYKVFTFGSNLSGEQTALKRTQQDLQRVQHQILVSQKASTKTRVKTVAQRCDLTHLILGVLVRVHDSPDAAPFQASLITCEKQLASVKQIDAKTPKP